MSAIKRISWTPLLVALLIVGCSREPPTATAPPATAPPSAYTAVARGRVDVEGGLLNVFSPREGRIAQVLVKEGQHVQRGAKLVQLDDAGVRLAVSAAEAGVRESAAQLQVMLTQVAPAGTRAQRLRAAAAAGAGEGQLADDAEAQARQLDAQHEVALAARATAESKLALERHELEMLTIVAAKDAVVTQVSAQAGGQIATGSGPLLVLLPDSQRIVRSELSEAYADAVLPQMSATVSAEDDPGHTWPAHVLRVSPVVGPARLEEDEQKRAAERTVECVLVLEGKTTLRIGQRVLVRIGPAHS